MLEEIVPSYFCKEVIIWKLSMLTDNLLAWRHNINSFNWKISFLIHLDLVFYTVSIYSKYKRSICHKNNSSVFDHLEGGKFSILVTLFAQQKREIITCAEVWGKMCFLGLVYCTSVFPTGNINKYTNGVLTTFLGKVRSRTIREHKIQTLQK